MNYNNFGCEREHIEQIIQKTQKNILIHLYCSDNFSFINLVDLYYRSINENAILMFIFICAIYPLLFMCVATIADKYLAEGMSDLSKRFNLSPTLAAVTLIAFANGAPDVLSSLSAAGKAGGELISLGSLYGGFIFSACLVVSNVVWNSEKGEIKIPKYATLKELGFYLMSIFMIIGFGFRGKTGYLFIGCYLALYAVYIVCSVVFEKWDKDLEMQEMLGLETDLEGSVGDDPNNFDVNNSKPFETQIQIEEKDTSLGDDGPKGFFAQVVDDIVDEECSTIENILLMPLVTAGMLTVSYLSNPFMKTPAKYLILASSIVFMFYTLELLGYELFTLIIIGLSFGLVFFILEVIQFDSNVLEIAYEFISVFAAIGWISIFSGIIIDFISFLAFYFNINEVILSSILLSAGNTIGDFFGNGALSKAGESVMGAIASYSGQIFNNFVGFSFNILGSMSVSDSFDIFAANRWEGKDPNEEVPMPVSNIYVIVVIISAIILVCLNIAYYLMNNFTLKTSYTYILVAIYLVFFTCSLIFGLTSG